MKDEKRFIIIDGHAILHRAYHALPPLTTKKGELVSAVYGFLLVFFKAIKELRPDYIVATFDLPGPTFRHKKFEAYKANRPKTPEEFYLQIPRIKEILKSFNIAIFEKEGYEADDLIGTIACLVSKKSRTKARLDAGQISPKINTIILSGDLDVLQLIDPQTKVWFLRKGVKDIVLYDEGAVGIRYQGLRPDQLSDYKALRGDPSDNIPGAPGIGEKTAIELLTEFGTIESLYKELELKTEKAKKLKVRIREILIQSKEQVFLSKMLATIDRNVEIDFNLEKYIWSKYDKEKTSQLLKKLDFFSLVNRLP